MEVGRGQELGLARGKPFRPRRALTFWAVAVAARVVGDAGQATGVALFEVAAERRRPTSCDRPHDATLAASKMDGVIAKVGVAMTAENVGEFERRPLQRRLLGRRHLQ